MGYEWTSPLAHEFLDMPRRVPYKTYKSSQSGGISPVWQIRGDSWAVLWWFGCVAAP